MKFLAYVVAANTRNTEIMLQDRWMVLKEQGAEVELVTVAGKTITPCDSCISCFKNGKCHIRMTCKIFYPKLLSRWIIFGTLFTTGV